MVVSGRGTRGKAAFVVLFGGFRVQPTCVHTKCSGLDVEFNRDRQTCLNDRSQVHPSPPEEGLAEVVCMQISRTALHGSTPVAGLSFLPCVCLQVASRPSNRPWRVLGRAGGGKTCPSERGNH